MNSEIKKLLEKEEHNLDNFTVKEKMNFLREFVRMIITNNSRSLIILGSGGLGKTTTVRKELDTFGLDEDEEYVVISAKITPKGLYETLKEYSNKIIIFDDCDSALINSECVMILKPALDSNTDRPRIITYRTSGATTTASRFEFKGSIIFISNLDFSSIDQAILSRSHFLEINMSMYDKIEYMKMLIEEESDKFLPEISVDKKLEALELLNLHKDNIRDLNIRTLINVCKIRSSLNEITWKKAALFMILKS